MAECPSILLLSHSLPRYQNQFSYCACGKIYNFVLLTNGSAFIKDFASRLMAPAVSDADVTDSVLD